MIETSPGLVFVRRLLSGPPDQFGGFKLQDNARRPLISGAVFIAALRSVDAVLLLVTGLLASRLAVGFEARSAVMGQPVLAAIIAASIAVAVLNRMGVYKPGRLTNTRYRVQAGFIALLAGGLADLGWTLISAAPVVPDWWPLLWMSIGGVVLASATVATARSASSGANRDRLTQRVAVVGVNAYSREFIARMIEAPVGDAKFVGLYTDGIEQSDGVDCDQAVMGQIEDLVARSRRERIDAIVLALPLTDQERIGRSRAGLRSVTSDVYLAAPILELTCKDGQVDRLGSNPVIKIGSRPLDEWQTVQKSVMDSVLAAILLVAAFPILALIAVLVRLDSPGPILFRQPRLGFNNNIFHVLKFRTMYTHMTDINADRQTTRDDPRITRIGRLLRKTSLDEVPQVINVLRGEMSLVGPRPHAINTKAGDQLFHEVVGDYAVRHRVKPGITGWAQVNGWRGETRTREQLEQRVAHDLHYIDNWSLWLDCKILVLTVLRELNSKVAF